MTDLRVALGGASRRLSDPKDRGLLRFDREGVKVDVLDFDRAIAAEDPAALREAVEWRRRRGPLFANLSEGVFSPEMERWALEERARRERAYEQARPGKLPTPVASLVGREADVEGAASLLGKNRLVTLRGPGGIGKSRLAIEVATTVQGHYSDGAWLVQLAPLSDPSLVPQTIAAVLGVREEPGRLLNDTLIAHLASKSLLLVLDNCEHLLSACAGLADTLLQACPKLRILTTSWEGLGINGERLYDVPPLATPDPGALPPVEDLAQYGAVRLFVERVAQLDFAITDKNARFVAQVCHRLDGLPLAIELAAARINMLSAEQLAARLGDRFGLLTNGSRTALPRHQTLKACIDWSYGLLSEPERVVLRRLAVFAGGWTLEAAETVCADDGWTDGQGFDRLTQLVDKSFVTAKEQEDGKRYRLLQTLHQYADERLTESNERNLVRARHRDWCLTLAEAARTRLEGPEQAVWLDRLEREHDNLRAALEWCQQEGEEGAEAGLRLAGALREFWLIRGYMAEGRRHYAIALAQQGALEPAKARADALNGAGVLAYHQGDYAAARTLYEQSLALCRQQNDKQGIANAIGNIGLVAMERGDSEAARALYEECLMLHRELDDRQSVARSLNNLGNIAYGQGDFGAARALYEECMTLHRQQGDSRSVALVLSNLGTIAGIQGNYEAARTLFEDSLALRRELGDKKGIAAAVTSLGNVAAVQSELDTAQAQYEEALSLTREIGNRDGLAYILNNLGNVAAKRKNYRVARTHYEESLAIRQEAGDKRGVAVTLQGLGSVARSQGDHAASRVLLTQCLALCRELQDKRVIASTLEELGQLDEAQEQTRRAVRLFGAAKALREAIGAPLAQNDRAEIATSIAGARAALGGSTFTAAWAQGRAMPLEKVVSYALESDQG